MLITKNAVSALILIFTVSLIVCVKVNASEFGGIEDECKPYIPDLTFGEIYNDRRLKARFIKLVLKNISTAKTSRDIGKRLKEYSAIAMELAKSQLAKEHNQEYKPNSIFNMKMAAELVKYKKKMKGHNYCWRGIDNAKIVLGEAYSELYSLYNDCLHSYIDDVKNAVLMLRMECQFKAISQQREKHN